MSENGDQEAPKFCSECGLSLVNLNTWCSSRQCGDCGKEVFFVRRAENGGIKIEQGEKFHIPSITLSLDPRDGTTFSRYGLESFIKNLFLEIKLSKDEFIVQLKEIEKRIDKELLTLDCIKHVNLETEDGINEALEILEREQLSEYRFNLLRSGCIRQCYLAIESEDTLEAVHSHYCADMFKACSILENYHLKEIIWLGYQCYVDFVKNENSTQESSTQQILIANIEPKVASLRNEVLYALAKDGSEIAPRLGVHGIPENTLRSLLDYELEKRKNDRDRYYKDQDLLLKKKENTLKVIGIVIVIINGLILALYKDWIG
jgi:hypothetical protein